MTFLIPLIDDAILIQIFWLFNVDCGQLKIKLFGKLLSEIFKFSDFARNLSARWLDIFSPSFSFSI